jgi:general secretion pathway protein M
VNPRALSPEKSRRLALAVLAGAILAAAAVVAVPVWLAHRHYDQALADLTEKLERFRRVAATRADVAKGLEVVRAKEARKFYLRAGAAALSAAEAQEAMRTLVEGSGGRIITMQVPAAREEGRFRQVSVNVQLSANIVALRRILNAIESGTPMLFVDNLMVRSQVPATYRPGPGGEPEMFVQFDVYGYALTGT